MHVNCSKCGAEVEEGAQECPSCHASIATVLFGKKQNLTRTLIGRAVEWTTSIPWARESAIVQLDDKGRPPSRRRGVWVALLLIIVGGGVGYLLWSRSPTQAPASASSSVRPAEVAAAKVDPPAVAPPPAAPIERSPLAQAAPPAEPKPVAKAPAAKPVTKAHPTGTLSVSASHKGKVIHAKLMVNGESKGVTPVKVALAAGKYTLKLEKDGLPPVKKSDVKVDAGKSTALKVEMK